MLSELLGDDRSFTLRSVEEKGIRGVEADVCPDFVHAFAIN